MTALVAAILADPDADAPRLALADWYEERGDEAGRLRAAFVRLHCEAARLSAADPRREPLLRAARRLERQGRPAWLAGLPAFARRAAFARGFVGHVELTGVRFRADMPAVWEREPVVSVAFTGGASDTVLALADPLAGRLRAIDLSRTGMTPELVEVVRRYEHLHPHVRIAYDPPVADRPVLLPFPGRR
jgi:uncharacterized protein (TIGR02996 family)